MCVVMVTQSAMVLALCKVSCDYDEEVSVVLSEWNAGKRFDRLTRATVHDVLGKTALRKSQQGT
jgi:hypothetical protein